MKKFAIAVIAAIAAVLPASAMPPGIFDHLGLGVGVGTTGISIEASTPITRWVQMRAGVSIMPGIKFGVHDIDADYTLAGNELSTTIDLDGNLSRVQGQVIFNVYPIPMASFYVAAGAYFGGPTLVGIKGSSEDLANVVNGQVSIGDYTLPVNENGEVDGGIRVNGFRPYLGVGWGRAVPGKLLNFGIELGVQFHGKPELYTNDGEIGRAVNIDDDTFQKIMDKVKVYPNLTLRLNFRAF